MARIRSTHPGQWTDEEFVSCSFSARLLCLALRNEADDVGVFEWKPIGIKMKLMPADDVDVPAMLAELAANNQVRRFEHGGKAYGAIRNFCDWQRPKERLQRYPLPEEIAAYVGLKADDYRLKKVKVGGASGPEGGESVAASPPLPQDFPTASPIGPQRKEVGGSKEEERGNPPLPAAADSDSGASAQAAAAAMPVDLVDRVFARVCTRAVTRDMIRSRFRRVVALAGGDVAEVEEAIEQALADPDKHDPMNYASAAIRGRRDDATDRRAEAAAKRVPEPPPRRSALVLDGKSNPLALYGKGIPGLDADAKLPDLPAPASAAALVVQSPPTKH